MSQTTNNHDENTSSWGNRPGDDSSATNPAPAAQASSAPAGPTHETPAQTQTATAPATPAYSAAPGYSATQDTQAVQTPQAPPAPQAAQSQPGAQPYGQQPYGQQYGQTQQNPQAYGQQPQGAPQYGQQHDQNQWQSPYTRPQYGQTQQTGWSSGGQNMQNTSGGTQTLTAYPTTTDTQTGAPVGTQTGALPQAGWGQPGSNGQLGQPGQGGQPPLPPNGKKRREAGQPGWRGVIATGLGAALIASLLTAGVVLAVNNDDPSSATSSLTSSSQSGDSAEAPVTTSSSENADWKAVASAVEPSVVSVQVTSQSSEGEGSGVILDTDGRIVTNNHVVTGAQTIEVVLNDGRKYTAKVVGTDSATDLAVIQLEDPPSDLKPATLGDTDSVSVGDSVMAVGNPLGLAGTVTTGIVSAVDRPVTTSSSESSDSSSSGSGETVVTNAIQIDAAVNPGNSGGALVDAQGKLIGINSSIATLSQSSGFGQESSSQSGSIGLGFAIPVDQVKNITNQLIENGSAQHPWLGITLGDATVKVDNAERDGASVQSVVADSPAETAGLKKGDTVIAIDGEYINGAESLMAQVRERTPGTEVTVSIVRDGKTQDVKVTLDTRPDSAN
ncbi:hypothetical protein GCM10022223_57450 [Kineosporia mesophila]|uniref:PDZ domain-containing protein n=1 Tax=Kineosporia mesophila TaxID=566012 RepID=A0ABP7AHE6_9ACTN|nr:trypsin-like peptidase domain-containing protein [Kineosporia mesophila]MCD5350889.1 trypsin-like peptidase domain-containing protein [Kineosporia mesophila]